MITGWVAPHCCRARGRHADHAELWQPHWPVPCEPALALPPPDSPPPASPPLPLLLTRSIQVNTLLPGAINTPFLNIMLANPKKLDYILHRIPLGEGGPTPTLHPYSVGWGGVGWGGVG